MMYPDAGGARPTFRAMAQELADLGYAVLLPNPYYRLGQFEPFDVRTVFTDPAERARLMELAGSVTEEGAARHRGHARLPRRAAGGGRHEGRDHRLLHGRLFALTAAGRFPDRVAAAASFHGGQIASTAPDSPHLLAPAMRARVYVAGAEDDASFDAEQARTALDRPHRCRG